MKIDHRTSCLTTIHKKLSRQWPILLLLVAISISLSSCKRGKEAEEIDLQEARRLRGVQSEENVQESEEKSPRSSLTLDPDRAIQPSQRRKIFRNIPQEYRETTPVTQAPTEETTPPTTEATTEATTSEPTSAPTTTVAETTLETTSEPSTKPTTKATTSPDPENVITIKFDTHGGPEIPNQSIVKGSLIEEPEVPEIEGQTFVGWFYLNEYGNLQEFDFETQVLYLDFTLDGVWNPGFGDPAEPTQPTETTPDTEPTVTTPDTEPTVTTPSTEDPTAEPTTQPTTKEGSFVITLITNGGTETPPIEYYPSQGALVLPAPTMDGFEFLGWVDASGNAISTDDFRPGSDMTLYAQWKELIPQDEPVPAPLQGVPAQTGNYIQAANRSITNLTRDLPFTDSFQSADEIGTKELIQSALRGARRDGALPLSLDALNERVHATFNTDLVITAEMVPADASYTFDPGSQLFYLNEEALPAQGSYDVYLADASGDDNYATAHVYKIDKQYLNDRVTLLVLDGEVVGYREPAYGDYYLVSSFSGYTSYTYTLQGGKVTSKTMNPGGGLGNPSASTVGVEQIQLHSETTVYNGPSNGNLVVTNFSAGTSVYATSIEENGYQLVFAIDGAVPPAWVRAEDLY